MKCSTTNVDFRNSAMVIDTSALVAILRQEPEAAEFLLAIQSCATPRISTGNLLEAALVIDGARSPIASRRFTQFFSQTGIVVEPFTETQARIAREAYRDFGQGSGHPAKLNFGDCFAYALAKDKQEALLFKGQDFTRTDVEPWVPEED